MKNLAELLQLMSDNLKIAFNKEDEDFPGMYYYDGLCFIPNYLKEYGIINNEEFDILDNYFMKEFISVGYYWPAGDTIPRLAWLKEQINNQIDNNMKKDLKKTRVELLVEQANNTPNAALKSALTQHAEEEKEKEAKRLLKEFTTGSKTLDQAVQNLIEVRKQEKEKKAQVVAIDSALEQFKKDADYTAFTIACNKVSYWI